MAGMSLTLLMRRHVTSGQHGVVWFGRSFPLGEIHCCGAARCAHSAQLNGGITHLNSPPRKGG